MNWLRSTISAVGLGRRRPLNGSSGGDGGDSSLLYEETGESFQLASLIPDWNLLSNSGSAQRSSYTNDQVRESTASLQASNEGLLFMGRLSISSSSTRPVPPSDTPFLQDALGQSDERLHWKDLYDDFATVDWIKDKMRDHRRHKLVQSRHKKNTWSSYLYLLYDFSQSWILLSLTGITIGMIAAWINVSASWLTDIRVGVCSTEWYYSKKICCMNSEIRAEDGSCEYWWDWSYYLFGIKNSNIVSWVLYISLSTFIASLCSIIVWQMAPFAAGSGTAEVKTILGGFIIKQFLGFRTLVVKCVCLPLTVASGLAVGKEGPMIHVACCIGNTWPKLFAKYRTNEARKREILSASCASGVAVAFGAPIGGVLFSLEELSSFFPPKTMIRSFYMAIVSCVTLQLIDPYHGKRVMYQVTYSRDWHIFEALFFVILGIFGGLSGAFLIRMNVQVQKFRRKTSWLREWPWPVVEVAVIGLATSILFYMNSFTRIDSSELLEYLFRECAESNFNDLCDPSLSARTVFSLTIALLLRMFFTTITLGIKVPAGIFIPAMVWGALFGRILGITVEAIQRSHPALSLFLSCHPDKPCVTPGMYALLGAVSALGGVTRLTVSLTVIMFELTGTLNYIIPCMITLMVSKLVGDAFGGYGGMTDVMIRLNKYPFLHQREEKDILSKRGIFRAEDVMTPFASLTCLHCRGMVIRDVETILDDSSFRGFPVINSPDHPNIVGFITRSDLKYALKKAKINQIDPASPIFFDDTHADRSSLSSTNLHHQSFSPTDADAPSPYEYGGLNLTYYMDKTPLAVHPKMSIDTVFDFFSKLGLRYLIIKHNGLIQGLITKKDLLTTIFDDETFDGGLLHWMDNQRSRAK